MAQPPAKIDRQTTTPFLLRLVYKQGGFHRLDEFDPALPRLPSHLQIYTWQSCTLRELCKLLLSALPTQLPQPYTGARIAFRLIYPDMQGSNWPGAPGRFISRDIGSVIVGARGKDEDADMEDGEGTNVADALRQLDGDPDKTLADAKFLIGDYVACAILPPLPDGGVPSAPPPVSAPLRGGPAPGPYGGGRGRENGFGGRGDFGFDRRGRGGGGVRYDDRRMDGGVPSGEWRRGEAPPDRDPGFGRDQREQGFGREREGGFGRDRDPGFGRDREPGFGRGRGRGGGDSGDWRGRGRGRW